MEPKAPQLSAYDFLGYLVPGLALLALFDLSCLYHFSPAHFNYPDICARYANLNWQSFPPLIILGYFGGHVVSFASAVVVERHALWLYDKPAKFLVHQKNPRYFDPGGPTPRLSKCIRCVVFIFMLPIAWFEWLAFKVLGLTRKYHRPLDKLLIQALTVALKDLGSKLKLDSDSFRTPGQWGNGFESLALHCALETAPAHLMTLRNYVVLYGFLRAMTLLFLLAAWTAICHEVRIYRFDLVIGTFVVSTIFCGATYGAFLKFWTRYHREALMAFVASYVTSQKTDQSQGGH